MGEYGRDEKVEMNQGAGSGGDVKTRYMAVIGKSVKMKWSSEHGCESWGCPQWGIGTAEAQRGRCGAPGRRRWIRGGYRAGGSSVPSWRNKCACHDTMRGRSAFRPTGGRGSCRAAAALQHNENRSPGSARPALRRKPPLDSLRPKRGLGPPSTLIGIGQYGLIGCRAQPRQRFLVGDRTLAARQEPRPPIASSAPLPRCLSGGCSLGVAR